MVTSHDVAARAGVSQPTVSRALRDDPRVAVETKRRVAAAAAELGYVASELGRSLRTRTTRQIAMVADLRNALYPTLVEPLHDRFAEHGLRMVLLAERGDDRATYEKLLDRSVDGVVLTTTSIRSTLSKSLIERGLPFVELNRLSGRRGVHGVTADNRGGASEAVSLLVEAGHRRVALVLGDPTSSTSRDREAGARDVLDAAGLELPDGRVVRGPYDVEAGEHALDRLMSGRHRPTAVFCAGDSIAIGVLNQAQRRGLQVPDDLAVVGFDDLPVASWPSFALTTVAIDLRAMAVAAADALVAQLSGGAQSAAVQVFPARVVLRSTHGR